MKLGTKLWGSGLVLVAVVVALLGLTMAFADNINPNPSVLDINGKVGGLTYGEWSAKWWQRAFSLPDNFTNCTENQPTGPVWFLDGTTAGSATRSCTVPAGKNIMFPIFNSEQSVVEARSASPNEGNLPGSTCHLLDINGKLIKGTGYAPLLRCAQAFSQHAFDSNSKLEAEVDGTPLTNLTHYRAHTPPPPFPYTAVEGNPLNLCSTSDPKNSLLQQACPVSSKAVADGYWIILQKPLSAGPHIIHFKADVPFIFNMTPVDVTYNLTVL